MPVRTLMVDVDGVLIRRLDGGRWDRRLLVDLGLDPAVLAERFFEPFFERIVLGRDDLRDRLADVLPSIAPHLDADALMEYWFAQDATVDTGLTRDLDVLRAAGVNVHLATTQEHYRAHHLWTAAGLSRHADRMHYSAAIGHAKPHEAFFRSVERSTGRRPDELLLIDDREVNVDAAIRVGWGGHLWTPSSTLADLGLDIAGTLGAD